MWRTEWHVEVHRAAGAFSLCLRTDVQTFVEPTHTHTHKSNSVNFHTRYSFRKTKQKKLLREMSWRQSPRVTIVWSSTLVTSPYRYLAFFLNQLDRENVSANVTRHVPVFLFFKDGLSEYSAEMIGNVFLYCKKEREIGRNRQKYKSIM